MIQEILLPDLGEGIENSEVSEVLISVGDKVGLNETVLVLESDKASMEIPLEIPGVVKEVFVNVGDEIKTGHLLFKIETEGIKKKTNPSQSKEVKQKQEIRVPKKEQSPSVDNVVLNKTNRDTAGVFASPGVRRLARELNINLSIINGTGDKGRITKLDLHGYIKAQMSLTGGVYSKDKVEVDFSKWGKVEVQKLTKIKKITGKRLQEAWQTIPHVTQYDEADITELDRYRRELKKTHLESGIKITFLPFLMKGCVRVLKKFSQFNSSLDYNEKNLIIKKHFHIGIAVDTKAGLVVPVIKDVDKKTILDLSKELMDISSRSKNRALKPDEMKGGTFTISSLGGIGGTGFSPIVNPPEVAIMGVSKSQFKPVYYKETQSFEPRLIMPFSISYDHRVIDGATGAKFTSVFSSVLSDVSFFREK